MRSDRRSLRAVPAVLRHAVAIGLLALVPLGAMHREDVALGAQPAARACQDGACTAASERIAFDDSAYGAAGLPVEVRYPGSLNGTRAVADGAFPRIVFGHGYRQSYADYACIWEAPVPHGYIIASLDKLSSSVAINMDAYARDLLFVAAKMHSLAGDAASRYFGRIAEGTALMGQSTGGAALVAASQTSAATTVVTLAPLRDLVLTPVAVAAPYLIRWLAFHLMGDAGAWERFIRLLDTDAHTSDERRP